MAVLEEFGGFICSEASLSSCLSGPARNWAPWPPVGMVPQASPVLAGVHVLRGWGAEGLHNWPSPLCHSMIPHTQRTGLPLPAHGWMKLPPRPHAGRPLQVQALGQWGGWTRESGMKQRWPGQKSPSEASRQTLFYPLPCPSEWMLKEGKWIPTWGRESPWGDLPSLESVLPCQPHFTAAPWGRDQASLSDATSQGSRAHWLLLFTSMHREGSVQSAGGGSILGPMPSRKGYSDEYQKRTSCGTLAKSLEVLLW